MRLALLTIVLLTFAVCATCRGAASGDLYVAPNGDDTWSGKLPSPNPAHTDGPFATLDRARLAVRGMREKAQFHRPVTVLVRAGVYYLKSPLLFEPEDSGAPESPTVYAAYPGESPVFSGGRLLGGWQRDANGWWHTSIPDAPSGKSAFLSIYVNGERRFRPRLPKRGYYHIYTSLPVDSDGKPNALAFGRGDIRPDWSNSGDVEVLTLHLWNMSRMRIESVDAAANSVKFSGATMSDSEWGGFRAGYPYLVENVKEALGEPGEWYLDKPTGKLTYIPRRGESIASAEVVAPKLDRILEMRGDWRSGRYVSNIEFRGLSFEHSNWYTPKEGYHFSQSDGSMPGAIFAQGARNCRWAGCRVRHTGAYAIEIGAGCKRNLIDDCELTDLGAGGVKLGFWSPREPAEATTSHNLISNCLIAHGGRISPGGTGVLLDSHHNVVRNNDIFDFYYDGIAAGFTWERAVSAHSNTIENNRIFDIGQGVLSDMGAIYTLGDSPGTVIRHNLIHDVKSSVYGGWGIYFDAESSNILVENNIIYRTDGGTLHQVRGSGNRVTNNILAYCTEQQIMREPAERSGLDLDHNIILWRDSFPLGGDWKTPSFKLDSNLYWDESRRPVVFDTRTLEQWRKEGQDAHSLVADPLFADPRNGDFSLSPLSPALKLGFKPISTAGIGRRSVPSGGATSAPRAFPPVSPIQLKYNCEDLPVGARPPHCYIGEENSAAGVRVSDEAAASGKHSLKFVDDGKQQAPWNPMVVYGYKCIDGTVLGRFSVYLKPGASFRHEWRDTVVPDKPGPSVFIDGDANLFANGVSLGAVPTGKWLTVEISCVVGASSRAEYSLKLSEQGGPIRVYRNLKHSPEFHRLMWVGFIAEGTGPGVFYVDDIDFKLK